MSQSSYKKRIVVLRGGPSSEYEVSLKSGEGVLSALSRLPYVSKDIIIAKNGEWLVNGFVKSPEKALVDADVVFLALHGLYGEDGTVQRTLEKLSIPFTGSGSYASAVAMNKGLTKDFLKKNIESIKMAPHMKISRSGSSNIAQVVQNLTELFGPEYMIKPINGGSSIGTILVNQSNLLQAVIESLKSSEQIIVEKRIVGKEATVGIIENFRDARHYSLPEIEIKPPEESAFFSADVKYNGKTEEICPGRFSKDEKKELARVATLVHSELGLRQYSRSDFIVANDGIYFLEVNTLPGLTNQSLFPKAMEAVGSNYDTLIAHLVETASFV